MGSRSHVVRDVVSQHSLKSAGAQRNHVIQAFTSYGSDEA
jgi:hypothetical protein